jgi:hypothetical protein
MRYANSVNNLVQGLPKALPIVWVIELSKPDYSTLQFPVTRRGLLDPMPSDSEVPISIARLPGITCQVNDAWDNLTLNAPEKSAEVYNLEV